MVPPRVVESAVREQLLASGLLETRGSDRRAPSHPDTLLAVSHGGGCLQGPPHRAGVEATTGSTMAIEPSASALSAAPARRLDLDLPDGPVPESSTDANGLVSGADGGNAEVVPDAERAAEAIRAHCAAMDELIAELGE